MIKRVRGDYSAGISQAVGYKDLVWTVATALDDRLNLVEQTKQALQSIEDSLIKLGSDKTQIVSAQIYLARMSDKPAMNKAWLEWLGNAPEY